MSVPNKTTGISIEERRLRSERLKSRLLGIMEGFDAGASIDVKQQEDEISRLEARIYALRDALQWYASPRTWNQWCPDSFGDLARKSLAKDIA